VVCGATLRAGKGIGGINLGARVQEVLAIMQRHPDVFTSVEVKFCAEDLGAMDLLIECKVSIAAQRTRAGACPRSHTTRVAAGIPTARGRPRVSAPELTRPMVLQDIGMNVICGAREQRVRLVSVGAGQFHV